MHAPGYDGERKMSGARVMQMKKEKSKETERRIQKSKIEMQKRKVNG